MYKLRAETCATRLVSGSPHVPHSKLSPSASSGSRHFLCSDGKQHNASGRTFQITFGKRRPSAATVACSSELAQRLTAIHATQRLPGDEGNIVADKADRAIAQGNIDAAGMPAAGRLLAIGG